LNYYPSGILIFEGTYQLMA